MGKLFEIINIKTMKLSLGIFISVLSWVYLFHSLQRVYLLFPIELSQSRICKEWQHNKCCMKKKKIDPIEMACRGNCIGNP